MKGDRFLEGKQKEEEILGLLGYFCISLSRIISYIIVIKRTHLLETFYALSECFFLRFINEIEFLYVRYPHCFHLQYHSS